MATRRLTHLKDSDYHCERCGWDVKSFIPHECDPSICYKCNGKGEEFIGRDTQTREWKGWGKCPQCAGTGRTIWND